MLIDGDKDEYPCIMNTNLNHVLRTLDNTQELWLYSAEMMNGEGPLTLSRLWLWGGGGILDKTHPPDFGPTRNPPTLTILWGAFFCKSN